MTNRNELIQALNLFEFALVIFDMHGGHDSDGNGYLMLSEEKFYPIELVEQAIIPPIVLLSACDTSPADRSHFNVANAFLCGGAKTVIASTYPILSKNAAIYVARLYTRISMYLPERIYREKSLRWSEFMTALNRRVYFGSFIKHIIKKYKINDQVKIKKLNELIHIPIEVETSHLLDGIFFCFNNILGLTKEQVIEELSNEFLYDECMNYVQIGSPEKILIHAADMAIE